MSSRKHVWRGTTTTETPRGRRPAALPEPDPHFTERLKILRGSVHYEMICLRRLVDDCIPADEQSALIRGL